MSHAVNINLWREYAQKRGWSYPTPHDWLLCKMGVECPPALFWPPWINGILSGVFFGLFWGAFMFFTVWRDHNFYQISIPSAACAVLFGLWTSIFHWYQRRKMGVTTWEEFLRKNQS
jgi:hypothetical protein